jgi:hypothetical protein
MGQRSSHWLVPIRRRGRPLYGSLYLALHPHGTQAWGRWVGMSYDGEVITGYGGMARTESEAHQIVEKLVNPEGS